MVGERWDSQTRMHTQAQQDADYSGDLHLRPIAVFKRGWNADLGVDIEVEAAAK